MTTIATAAAEWIAHDPDPQTAAELSSCTPEELDRRFSNPLTFGTAGLRGPLRGGPDAMNLAVVIRTTWALAQVLKDRCLGGSHVVVGRDARHRSDEFALAAAEVLAAEGFQVVLMMAAVPTPIVAYTVRHLPAVAGIQITASHNRPTTATRCFSTVACRSSPLPTVRSRQRWPERRMQTKSADPPWKPVGAIRSTGTWSGLPGSAAAPVQYGWR